MFVAPFVVGNSGSKEPEYILAPRRSAGLAQVEMSEPAQGAIEMTTATSIEPVSESWLENEWKKRG